MNWHTVALPMIIVGVIAYQLSQKSVPKDANPFLVLAVAYLIAFSVSLALFLLRGDLRKDMALFRPQDALPILFLGLTAVAIELGYLYAFRTGWKISSTGIITAAFTTVALMLIGVFWYKEHLTLVQAAGIGLCLAGIICISSN